MSDPKNNSGKTLSTGIESHQGARLNIKSDQGSAPLSNTGHSPRPMGSNTGITSEAKPPKPTSLPK